MTIIDTHVFRCEIYGQYINVKKTNRPVLYGLGIAEIIVNAEPTSKYNSMRISDVTFPTFYRCCLGVNFNLNRQAEKYA